MFPFVKALLQDLYEMESKVLNDVELDAIGLCNTYLGYTLRRSIAITRSSESNL